MEGYTWWKGEHNQLAHEVREFVKEFQPRAEEAWWRREFPWDIMKEMAKQGYFGLAIPAEYGGRGLGATGACIAVEEIFRLPGVGIALTSNILIGEHISSYGTEEQKREWLPRIVGGEVCAIAITEPFVGTDTFNMETTAKRDENCYLLTGKKRFVTFAGMASLYMTYARTSGDSEDMRKRRHLTVFLVERGMPGFSVEKVNELIGIDNVTNGYLNLDEVPVPLANRFGKEGEGLKIMLSGLNYERVIVSAQSLAVLSEAIRTVVPFVQRRIQFGKPIIDIQTNQFKIADMIMNLKMGRLATYYAAHLLDAGQGAALESSICKVFDADMSIQTSLEAIQVMGGDGVTKFYPVERLLRDSKIWQIAGGTSEAIKNVIFRIGLREIAEDLKMQRRVIHEELGVPVPTTSRRKKQVQVDENTLLQVLSEDYKVNPGLYMTCKDLQEVLEVEDERLYDILISLEEKGLVKLYREGSNIIMAKATYQGLKRANPFQYYRWFPSWVRKEDIF
jgi:alkylation response protein AidB-like acyl-CoA dehydrogenase